MDIVDQLPDRVEQGAIHGSSVVISFCGWHDGFPLLTSRLRLLAGFFRISTRAWGRKWVGRIGSCDNSGGFLRLEACASSPARLRTRTPARAELGDWTWKLVQPCCCNSIFYSLMLAGDSSRLSPSEHRFHLLPVKILSERPSQPSDGEQDGRPDSCVPLALLCAPSSVHPLVVHEV